MNCKACQRRLLATENLEAPDREVRKHLRCCAACRAWVRRLNRIEGHVPVLPVPWSRSKQRFLHRFLGRPAARPAVPKLAPPRLPWWRRRKVLRVVGAVAAVLLLATGVYLGVWLAQYGAPDTTGTPVARLPPEPDQDLVARLIECDVRLAEASTPSQRVETLAQVAAALHRESRALSRVAEGKVDQAKAASEKELQALARLYRQVIRDGVVPSARKLPTGKERRAILGPIVAELGRAEKEARHFAEHAAAASEPLLQIAAAARAGDHELRRLMEGTP